MNPHPVPFKRKPIKNIDIPIKMGLAGHITLVKERVVARNDKGLPTKTEPVQKLEFENLITNYGLNLYATAFGNCYAKCFVGSSNTPPANSDTVLASAVAGQSYNGPSTTTGIVAADYVYGQYTYQFAEGAAAGNLQEIGFGHGTLPSSYSLWSRALIKDEFGDPTTLTVLSDEILTVTYQIRITIPTGDITGTIGGYSYTMRPCQTDQYGNIYGGVIGWYFQGADSTVNYMRFATGAIQGEDSEPAGTTVSWLNTWTLGSYTADSYTRQFTIVKPITLALIVIQSIAFVIGPAAYQMQISPTIDNTGTDKEITITLSLTWARAGELP